MTKKRLRIGFLLDFLLDEYQLKIWEGVMQAAKDYDINLYCFPGGELERLFSYSTQRNTVFDLVPDLHPDGVIIISAIIANYASKKKFDSFYKPFKSIPSVSIGMQIEDSSCLFIDNTKGIMQTVSHFVEEYHYKRIAFIKGPEKNPEAQERFNAYKNALAQYNIEFDPQLIAPGNFFTDAGEKAVSLFFDQRKISFDAIIAASDLTAIGTMKALERRGFEIPKDIALAGFDDINESRFTKPQLTTVHQPFMNLGYEAVNMLMAQIKGSKYPKYKVLPTHLRIRRSCGCTFKEKNYFFNHPVQNKNPLTPALLESIKQKLILEIEGALNNFFIDPTINSSQIKWITRIVEDCFASLLHAHDELFLTTFENLIETIESDNIDLFCWRRLLSLLFNKILSLLAVPKDMAALLFLWKAAVEKLWEIETRKEAQYRVKNYNLFRNVSWIGQQLLAPFNTKKFKKIISEMLPSFGINRFYITVYADSNKSLTHSRFIYRTEQLNLDKNIKNKIIKTDSIMSLCRQGKERRECLIILPLFIQNESLGFFILEHNNLEGLIYENIAIQLSNALKGAHIVDRFSKQTKSLSTSNKEKETLLKEIHHRVKNNLQVIYSFLNLQCNEISNIDAINHFKAIQNRIKSMAILHEQLYMNNNFSSLNLKRYLKSLIN